MLESDWYLDRAEFGSCSCSATEFWYPCASWFPRGLKRPWGLSSVTVSPVALLTG